MLPGAALKYSKVFGKMLSETGLVRSVVVVLSLGSLAFGVACSASSRTDPEDLRPGVPVGPQAPPSTAVPDSGDAGDGGNDGDGGGATRVLRVMTYDIGHAERQGLEALAAVIRAESPDLVGLADVDLGAPRTSSVNQAERLGQLTGMANLFRAATSSGDAGANGVALLSRYPMTGGERVVLPSPGEPRIVSTVDLDLGGAATMKVAVTALDAAEVSRAAQVAEVTKVLGSAPRSILLGSLGGEPSEPSIVTLSAAMNDAWSLVSDGGGATFPADVPTRRLDYVFVGKGLAKPTRVVVPDAGAAAFHRPVVCDIPVP